MCLLAHYVYGVVHCQSRQRTSHCYLLNPMRCRSGCSTHAGSHGSRTQIQYSLSTQALLVANFTQATVEAMWLVTWHTHIFSCLAFAGAAELHHTRARWAAHDRHTSGIHLLKTKTAQPQPDTTSTATVHFGQKYMQQMVSKCSQQFMGVCNHWCHQSDLLGQENAMPVTHLLPTPSNSYQQLFPPQHRDHAKHMPPKIRTLLPIQQKGADTEHATTPHEKYSAASVVAAKQHLLKKAHPQHRQPMNPNCPQQYSHECKALCKAHCWQSLAATGLLLMIQSWQAAA